VAGRETTKRKQQSGNSRAEPVPLPRGPYAISADVVAADQRRRLLDALPLVVVENGFEGTTVDQIVKVAQVRRNSFYEQFTDKWDCFAAAYEIAQERLLGVLTYQCYSRAGLADRIGSALSAGLDLLAADPALTQLIIVEAPAAGNSIAVRHHRWMDRYARLLGFAAIGSPDVAKLPPAVEPAVVGGVVSQIKQQVLAGKTKGLSKLAPELVQFVLSFYGVRAGDPAVPIASQPGAQGESSQPQSPDLAPALEPA
jgi:AcrR family transcriptional regulator